MMMDFKLRGAFRMTGWFAQLVFLFCLALFFISFTAVFYSVFVGTVELSVQVQKFVQLFQSLALFVFPPIVYAYFCTGRTEELFLYKPLRYQSLLLLGFIALVSIPFINYLSYLNQSFRFSASLSDVENWLRNAEDNAARITQIFLTVENFSGLMLNLLVMAIVPAVGEELFFRGSVQRILGTKFSVHTSVWVTAIVFSAFHLQFFGFFPRVLMGAFLGYLYHWSGNLWVPIVYHFMNNAIAVLLFYLQYHGCVAFNPDLLGTGNTFWLACVSLMFLVVTLPFLRKILVKKSVFNS